MSAVSGLRLVAGFVALLASTALAPAIHAADPPTSIGPSDRPNIVVIYLDDVNPHDGRLWGDGPVGNPALTPTLHRYFVEEGIRFENAIGETPLCCPGRAGFLSGLHTHNHGVAQNDVNLFDPTAHIGSALKDAGYTTMWAGKYMNRTNDLNEAAWADHGAGWSYFDAIDSFNGGFYDYVVHTKTGSVAYPELHSTAMIAQRTVANMRNAPAGSPIFAVLSPYNLHAPNTPLPGFASDARCNSMPSWKPANYNEQDVSDKPPYVRQLPLLTEEDGWPMKKYCREMLGIDWMADKVIDELDAQGRLGNTLLVFTADNGSAWGAHRIGQKKLTPYAAPVPLYMWWAGSDSSSLAVVDDVVSNIDLAPTFCDLAEDCVLGPYGTGQETPDGISLVPLLDGSVDDLDRDAVLASAWTGDVIWQGLRTTGSNPWTTDSNPRGLWHYVEWDGGFRELYNLATDPARLRNRAGKPHLAAIENSLAQRLAELLLEGRVGQNCSRPDAGIAFRPDGNFISAFEYYSTPNPRQTRKRTAVALGQAYDFWVSVVNRGADRGEFLWSATSSGDPNYTVQYFANGTDITSSVVAGTYRTAGAGGSQRKLRIRITVGSLAPAASVHRSVLRVSSALDFEPGGRRPSRRSSLNSSE